MYLYSFWDTKNESKRQSSKSTEFEHIYIAKMRVVRPNKIEGWAWNEERNLKHQEGDICIVSTLSFPPTGIQFETCDKIGQGFHIEASEIGLRGQSNSCLPGCLDWSFLHLLDNQQLYWHPSGHGKVWEKGFLEWHIEAALSILLITNCMRLSLGRIHFEVWRVCWWWSGNPLQWCLWSSSKI